MNLFRDHNRIINLDHVALVEHQEPTAAKGPRVELTLAVPEPVGVGSAGDQWSTEGLVLVVHGDSAARLWRRLCRVVALEEEVELYDDEPPSDQADSGLALAPADRAPTPPEPATATLAAFFPARAPAGRTPPEAAGSLDAALGTDAP